MLTTAVGRTRTDLIRLANARPLQIASMYARLNRLEDEVARLGQSKPVQQVTDGLEITRTQAINYIVAALLSIYVAEIKKTGKLRDENTERKMYPITETSAGQFRSREYEQSRTHGIAYDVKAYMLGRDMLEAAAKMHGFNGIEAMVAYRQQNVLDEATLDKKPDMDNGKEAVEQHIDLRV